MTLPKPTLDDLRIEDRDKAKSASRFWPVVGLVLFLGLLALVFWLLMKPKGIPVQTALARDATTAPNRTVLNASGYVTARRAATVSSKVTGKVTEVLIEEGMKVQEG